MEQERRFRYNREDFGELPVNLRHLDIQLNFFEDRVEVSNRLEMIVLQDLEQLTLDADDLEILRICLLEGSTDDAGTNLKYEYHRPEKRLVVTFPRLFRSGENLLIVTSTRCRPSDSLLEGIYKDVTPPGAPQQFISQCQQWGFQRIMPILDDCRAKCTMTTTIEADAAYTHLISNGDVDRRRNPDGRPVRKEDDPRRQIITYINRVPMAPYLFLVGVGTWDELVDEVQYPNGKKVRLEYLVPPGRTDGARIPMEILKEAVLWIGRTQEYVYPFETYRTICMNRSNFGGMENVGNTTIVTDAALVDEHTLDAGLLYAHSVVVHEFEHNQCGSETTMETPFDVWLNEAYTVDVERRFTADLFDPTFVRLRQVDSIRDPLMGPLAIEDGGHAGRIVREGFNHPDELIDGVTYVKAAEVVRSLRLLLGESWFLEGKRLYFSRYRNGNADTDQFFQCFEEVSGESLDDFKRQWLYRIGYPRVTVETIYSSEREEYRIKFRQEETEERPPFHLPVSLALVGKAGGDLPGSAIVYALKKRIGEVVIEGVKEEPAFASLNRDYSFYGTLLHENASRDERILQAKSDPNGFNRVEAVRTLTDEQRVRLLLNPEADIDEWWLELYGELLHLPASASLKAYLLRIDEQPLDRAYAVWYPELAAARDRLMASVNERYRSDLLDAFEGLDTYRSLNSPKDGIEERLLKSVLLELAVFDDSSDGHRVIRDHFRRATTANDRFYALMMLNRSSAPDRLAILEETYHAWHDHLSGYANYLRVVASGTRGDLFEQIQREKERPTFDIKQPTWCRALFLTMAGNSRMIWTEKGVTKLAEGIIELAGINTTTAGRMLNGFQHVKRLKPDLRQWVVPALEEIIRSVPDSVSPTIHGQAKSYLEGVSG